MLFHTEPVYKNMSISMLGPHRPPAAAARGREATIARRHVQSLSIRPPTVETLLGNLSGGNQQKVALAKWLT